MSKVSELVKEARINAGLTQIEVVDQLSSIGIKITQSKLSRIESGTYKMPTEWLLPFAKIYGINPLNLFLTDSEINNLK
ncbi:hypothetical protein AOC36_09710 [Erysipelothrix larvae]|uniref:HTH cro/C1-type domain-containing protein n=1 Tax=Erysipelothrix larvae TaxID=1514105 RepID=A0A0X8H1H8_9FIRM|nr:helix-turn-helix transcriptional regulator [Erysipelothrix larvae]AMC94249.1 hypothetical protein AOC36_09710 [Erysipelothrix larvae]